MKKRSKRKNKKARIANARQQKHPNKSTHRIIQKDLPSSPSRMAYTKSWKVKPQQSAYSLVPSAHQHIIKSPHHIIHKDLPSSPSLKSMLEKLEGH